MNYNYKGLIFDLDGTLAPSKSEPLPEMQKTFCEALERFNIAIVSGATFAQFIKQFVGHLPCSDFSKLLLMPTNGAAMYVFENGQWKCLEDHTLSDEEVIKVTKAIEDAMEEFGIPHTTEYGIQIENRGPQVTFSGCGQEAPISVKEKWDPDMSLRTKVAEYLRPLLPEFEVRVAGMTSVDVTKKGIDKAYAVRKILSHWNFETKDVLYVGDALYPGGNDELAATVGEPTYKVKDPIETEKLLKKLIDGK